MGQLRVEDFGLRGMLLAHQVWNLKVLGKLNGRHRNPHKRLRKRVLDSGLLLGLSLEARALRTTRYFLKNRSPDPESVELFFRLRTASTPRDVLDKCLEFACYRTSVNR